MCVYVPDLSIDVLDALEPELQPIVDRIMWVLGTELGPSTRSRALNHWIIPPAHSFIHSLTHIFLMSGYHSVTWANLVLMAIPLSDPPKCWYYTYEPPHLSAFSLLTLSVCILHHNDNKSESPKKSCFPDSNCTVL